MVASCGGGGGGGATAPVPAATATVAPNLSANGGGGGVTPRSAFLGAFFRPEGPPPFGVFSASATDVAPSPYPTAGGVLFGASGYCSAVARNGVSIMTGYPVDPTKLADIVSLGVKWTRTSPTNLYDDGSHVFGAGHYTFADFDSAQCSLEQHGITPVIAISAGPVDYDAVPGTLSPQYQPIYESASDFGQWCTAVAKHESATFGVTRYTLPGNEPNSNTTAFPGGATQVAQYARACYAAIKAVAPSAFVYGFELNMDPSAQPVAFVQQMSALGCSVGTCYDGLAIHLSLTYPIAAAGTPCLPEATMQCIAAMQSAAGSPVHVLISESGYFIPGTVPDETTKAAAIVAEMTLYAADPVIDGALYGNVDECALYPTGPFTGGCLIDTSGNILPGYTALAALAAQNF
jgi:hypothetical protein